MPKKSKKSKSKRTTLKQKYKVIKKVKEHHKKKAKLDKKLGRKARKQKDPGIPGQWPFKQDLLKELEWEKQRAAAEQKRKKEERRLAQANAEKEDNEMADGLTMEDVQTEAAAKQRAFESQEAKPSTSGRGTDTDSSRRAFYKEFVKVVEAADVIIEVLDARDPLATRCTDVERYVRKSGAAKKLILLLNKIDLVPREAAEAWLKHLREELPTVAFKCSTQKQREHTGQRRAGRGQVAPLSASADHGASGGTCLGADMLLQLLKKYSLASGMKQAITVGVVGLPNVGKSSLINSLKRKHAAATGNTPGVTTAVQEVHLDKKITLLDSPGIVFSAAGNAHAALLNCTKVEQIEDPLEPAAEVVARCDQKQLMSLYRVGAYSSAEDLLRQIAVARGKLKPGGIPILEAAARTLLHDWNDGRIPYFTMPPQRDTHGHAAAAVVSALGQEFDVDQAFADAQSAMLADLPSVEEGEFTQTQAGQPASATFESMDADEGLRRMSDDEEDDDEESEDEEAMIDGAAGQARRLAGQAAKGSAVAPQQQAAKLYQEEGQFNPHAARAQRKQAKKGQRRRVSLATQKAAEEEYDFAEAFDNVAVGSDED